jgi:hypothetical protein
VCSQPIVGVLLDEAGKPEGWSAVYRRPTHPEERGCCLSIEAAPPSEGVRARHRQMRHSEVTVQCLKATLGGH